MVLFLASHGDWLLETKSKSVSSGQPPFSMAKSPSEITVQYFVDEISNFRVANKGIVLVGERKTSKWVFVGSRNNEDGQGNFSESD